MSESDKTGSRLVATIRKTKAGTAAKSPADSASSGVQASAGPAGAAPKPATTAKRVVKKTTVKSVQGDPYQSAPRVWPD